MGLGKQIIVRICIHGFGIAYIGSIQVENEVAESGKGKDTKILLLHKGSLLRCTQGIDFWFTFWLDALSKQVENCELQ
jgi:hypothetical protein